MNGILGFFSNEQLAKVFVIPKHVFDLIKDSTFYPEKTREHQKKYDFDKKEYEKPKIIVIEINKASEEELLTIKGILFLQKI